MRIRIKGHEEFNRRERIREDMLKSGIHIIFPAAPREDPNKVITEKLDQLLARTPKEPYDKHKVWFTRVEAAEYLSVSAKTIDRCRQKNDLPYHQIQGTSSFRFKRQDLDRLMS